MACDGCGDARARRRQHRIDARDRLVRAASRDHREARAQVDVRVRGQREPGRDARRDDRIHSRQIRGYALAAEPGDELGRQERAERGVEIGERRQRYRHDARAAPQRACAGRARSPARHRSRDRRRNARPARRERACRIGARAGAAASPDSICQTSARSAARCANQPGLSNVGDSGKTPSIGKRPAVALKPATPQSAAGWRTEPPVSVPKATPQSPPATATADPDDEPPGIRCVGAIAGVARRRMRRVVRAERELGRARLAEDDGARALQRPNESTFAGRAVGDVDARSCRQRQAGRRVQVLERDRHAHQRAEIDVRARDAGPPHARRERAVRIDVREGVERAFRRRSRSRHASTAPPR